MDRPVLPDLYFDIKDGGLGMQPADIAGTFACMGTASKGTDNKIVPLTSAKDAVKEFGQGPLVDALVDAFSQGARRILAMKLPSAEQGSIGTITADSNNQGDGGLGASGNPVNDFDVVVQITKDGGLGEAQFKVSLHGKNGLADAKSVVIPTNGSYSLQEGGDNVGITLEFDASNGSFKAGDNWSFKTTAPQWSTAGLQTGLDKLIESAYSFEYVLVAGASTVTDWSAANTKAEDAASTHYRFFHVIMESSRPEGDVDTWVNSLVSDAASADYKRVSVVAGFARILDMRLGIEIVRNVGGIYAGRLAVIPVQRSAGRVADGPLKNVIDLPEGWTSAHIQSLDMAHYVTVRRFEGKPGLYITNARMMTDDTSDYKYAELRRVMDKACRVVRSAGLDSEHDEASLEGIQGLKADCQYPLDLMKAAKEVLDAKVEIPPAQDIFGTGIIQVNVRIVPVPIMRWIEVVIGFENPYKEA